MENNMNLTLDERIEKKSRVIKKVLIAILLALMAIVGGLVYFEFFHYQEVDLFANHLDFATEGYNGIGVVETSVEESYDNGYVMHTEDDDDEDYDEDYDDADVVDTSDEPLAMYNFANSVKYTIDKTSGLTNGDKVTITAKYDKNLAKKAKVKVKEDKKTFKVSGLKERFKKDGSDIPKKDVEKAKSFCQTQINSWARAEDNKFGELKKIQFVARKNSFYPKDVDTDFPIYDDAIIVTFSYKASDYTGDEWETRYGYMWINGLNKDTNFGKLGEYSMTDDILNGQNMNILGGYESLNEVEDVLDDVCYDCTVTKL